MNFNFVLLIILNFLSETFALGKFNTALQICKVYIYYSSKILLSKT